MVKHAEDDIAAEGGKTIKGQKTAPTRAAAHRALRLASPHALPKRRLPPAPPSASSATAVFRHPEYIN
jgi:hypothetical protein